MRGGRRFLHQEVLEKQEGCWFWRAGTARPCSPWPPCLWPWPLRWLGDLVLGTCKARAVAVDSLCHAEIRAPFQRLQEEGMNPELPRGYCRSCGGGGNISLISHLSTLP